MINTHDISQLKLRKDTIPGTSSNWMKDVISVTMPIEPFIEERKIGYRSID